MTETQLMQAARNSAWKILLIDDDKEDYLLTREMLRESRGRKFEVVWASTYAEGRQELFSRQYDAVLVDYDLGAHSGIELIREAAGRGYEAPLILFTGRGNYEVDAEALQAGATMYLTKGEVNPLLLERTIRYAVERRQTEEALRLARDEARRQEEQLSERNDALRKSEMLLRDFLEGTHDNFFALDRDWRFTYANAHVGEIIGVDPRTLIGKNYWELYPQYVGSEAEQIFRRVMAERAPFHYRQQGVYTNSLYDVSVYPTHEGIAVFSIDRTEEFMSQQRLEEERSRLEAVLQSLPVGVWIADAKGEIVGTNEQANRIWAGDAPLLKRIEKYSEYQAWDAQSGEKLRPEDYPVAAALRTGRPVEPVELRIRRFDGSEGYILVSARPIPDRHGELAGAVGINLDITGRKHAEASLKKSEQEYRALGETLEVERSKLDAAIEHLPVGVGISDGEGNTLSLNAAGLALHGFASEEEMFSRLGKYVEEFELRYPDGRVMPPEEWPAARALHGEFVQDYELILLNKQAGTRRIVSYSAAPVKNRTGETVIIVYVMQDMTERKQAEQALRDSEERFNKAFEASPNPIIISRLVDGKIENVNSAFEGLFGYSRSEAIGKTSIELGMYANPQDREEAVRRLLEEGAVRKIELDICNRAGEVRSASLSVAVVNISGEQAMVNVIEDITSHKQAEAALRHYAEELERSNQALQDFAFIASHDLQEPLRKITMFGGLLENKAAGRLQGEERDYLERMNNAAGRMQEMINGLLELSRVNTRAGEFAAVNLTQLVQDAVSDLEARIQAVGGQVQVDSLPTIQADEQQMRRLFLNLISNAIKYQRADVPPVVHVSAVTADGQVAIQVQDNGIGIAAEDTARIFQPFQRLHGRDVYEGTGLGLAICQKIVERHHGKIEVQSKEGEGTVFVVRLPVK